MFLHLCFLLFLRQFPVTAWHFRTMPTRPDALRQYSPVDPLHKHLVSSSVGRSEPRTTDSTICRRLPRRVSQTAPAEPATLPRLPHTARRASQPTTTNNASVLSIASQFVLEQSQQFTIRRNI